MAHVQRCLGSCIAFLCPLIFLRHFQLEGATSITLANGLMAKVILELSLPPLLFLLQQQSETKRSNKTVNPISSCDTNNCVIVILGCLYCNKLSLNNSLRTRIHYRIHYFTDHTRKQSLPHSTPRSIPQLLKYTVL